MASMSFLRQSLIVLALAAVLNYFNPFTSLNNLLQQFNEPSPVKLYGSTTST